MQQEISVLIIEDEPLWARSLQESLDTFGFQVAGVAANLSDAAAALQQYMYDVVLLDIHLQGRESGIELGHLIHALYHKPFIFITASMSPATVQAAISAKPSGYLTKPVHPASLFATIHTALDNFARQASPAPGTAPLQEASFFVKQGDKHRRLFWKDIVALRSEKNYTGLLNAADGTTAYIRSTLPKTLQFLVPQSLQAGFVQVNRSEAVQVAFIQQLDKEEVVTVHGRFKVSESYLKVLKEKLNILH
ncbi:MAG TPA: response regulator transcription factor [Chitinophagaceae bacterium]|jgi:DNA-binding LytR/AlgR family response regulator|nr:response regulator transcription factor [Chitinophagaceae bacterium]